MQSERNVAPFEEKQRPRSLAIVKLDSQENDVPFEEKQRLRSLAIVKLDSQTQVPDSHAILLEIKDWLTKQVYEKARFNQDSNDFSRPVIEGLPSTYHLSLFNDGPCLYNYPLEQGYFKALHEQSLLSNLLKTGVSLSNLNIEDYLGFFQEPIEEFETGK